MPEKADTHQFTRVKFKDKNSQTYGLVTGWGGDPWVVTMGIESYDFGFPCRLHISDIYEKKIWGEEIGKNKALLITPDEFIKHLLKRAKIINKKFQNSNGLAKACWASREHYIKGVIKKIGKRKEKEDWYSHTFIAADSPKTGVYIIGKASGSEPDRCYIDPDDTSLEGLTIEPRLSAAQVAAVVQHFFPTKFGSVIGGNRGANFNHGNVFNRIYFAYEIPEKAIQYVKDPYKFTFDSKSKK